MVKTKGGLDIRGAVALEPINGPGAPGRQAQDVGGSPGCALRHWLRI